MSDAACSCGSRRVARTATAPARVRTTHHEDRLAVHLLPDLAEPRDDVVLVLLVDHLVLGYEVRGGSPNRAPIIVEDAVGFLATSSRPSCRA
jgi:hypothetical protein